MISELLTFEFGDLVAPSDYATSQSANWIGQPVQAHSTQVAIQIAWSVATIRIFLSVL